MHWWSNLPLTGPFAVRWGRVVYNVLVTWSFALAALGLGGLMIKYIGLDTLLEVHRVSSIWSTGVEIEDPPEFDGELVTRNFVFHDYDLEVSYLHPEEGIVKFAVEFVRFFSGPDEGDPMVIRVLADDPQAAVTSWQAEAWGHQLALGGFGIVFGLAGLGVAFALAHGGLDTFATIWRLARTGHIVRAEILDAKSDGQSPEIIELELRVPPGVTHTIRYQKGSEDPALLGGTAIPILATTDGTEVVALHADGYPASIDNPIEVRRRTVPHASDRKAFTRVFLKYLSARLRHRSEWARHGPHHTWRYSRRHWRYAAAWRFLRDYAPA